MSDKAFNFDEYIRLGEPGKKERAQNWQIAIGLQQVDGLTPSEYLLETARKNIEGDITIDEVHERLKTYYAQSRRTEPADRTEEADKVSARVDEVLSERTFAFRPAEFLTIHKRLFVDVFKFAGRIRDYNISKDEWVLDGASVFYTGADSIRETLDYDFSQERAFSYAGLSHRETVEHVAKFISGIWQIHPFGEGNTRATAVFAIKYLRTLALNVENDMFKEHSWYFRNALVRANYNDYVKGVHATMDYLNRFFDNLLFGANYVLRNRELHIAYTQQKASTVEFGEKFGEKFGENETQRKIIDIMRAEPKVSAKAIAEELGVTSRAVEKNIAALKELGVVVRVGAAKGGHWEVKTPENGGR
jgi:fido (protein-threonine AMPylation protein)/biotin operon repressor